MCWVGVGREGLGVRGCVREKMNKIERIYRGEESKWIRNCPELGNITDKLSKKKGQIQRMSLFVLRFARIRA